MATTNPLLVQVYKIGDDIIKEIEAGNFEVYEHVKYNEKYDFHSFKLIVLDCIISFSLFNTPNCKRPYLILTHLNINCHQIAQIDEWSDNSYKCITNLYSQLKKL